MLREGIRRGGEHHREQPGRREENEIQELRKNLAQEINCAAGDEKICDDEELRVGSGATVGNQARLAKQALLGLENIGQHRREGRDGGLKVPLEVQRAAPITVSLAFE